MTSLAFPALRAPRGERLGGEVAERRAPRMSSEWVLREVARSVRSGQPERYGRIASILARAAGAADARILEVDGAMVVVVGAMRSPAGEVVQLQDASLAALAPPWDPVTVGSGAAGTLSERHVLVVPCVGVQGLVGGVELHLDAGPPVAGARLAQLSAAAEIVALALQGDQDRRGRSRAESHAFLGARAREEERERLEAQLVHAARLAGIGEATVGIVHDLAQPVLVLEAYVELLQEARGDVALAERSLPLMAHAARRISAMVSHLRDYARAERRPAAPVSLVEVSRLALELVAGARDADVRVIGDPAVTVLGDGARLEQVVVNLVANAIASGGAPVVVEASRHGDRACLEVRDRGPGVPVELRALVFEPFFTTRRRSEGTGLGLAICRRILEEHGGTIEVDDHEGGGAVFRAWLPLLPTDG